MTSKSNQRMWVVISIFLMAFISPAEAKVIYVDANGHADFNNIQAAINDSNDGDTILVADGRYTGDGNRDISFHGKAITVRSENGPQNCVVDNNEVAWGVYNPRAFYFHSGEGPSSVLDGLTISGGHVYNEDGGGILSLSSSPIIRNCIIRNNIAEYAMIGGGHGGGIALEDSNSLILNCTIINNGGAGGGIYCRSGSPTISNCLISSNGRSGIECYQCNAKISRCIIEKNGGGGGIYCKASTEIAFCTITGNYSYGRTGGGIHCAGNTIIRNCLISNNAAYWGGHSTSGGGVWCDDHSNPIIINCTIAYNHADGYGGGIGCYWSDPTVINSILWGNSALYYGPQVSLRHTGWPSSLTISFSNVQGGTEGIYVAPECILLWGEGNINADPCFTLPGYWDPNGTPEDANDDFWVDGDYHLKSQAGRWEPNSESWVKDYVSSPCIDAGNPGCPEANEPPPNGNRRNMGAYGGTAEASKSPPYWRSIADMTNDWIVDSNDLKVFVSYWLQTGECIPSDFDRSRSVDSNDFAIFAGQWRQIGPGPGITYDIGACIPVDFPSSAVVEFEPTRFTVTVEGQYILFEDMMRANCCPEELDVQMTVEGDLITIYEIERFFTRVPCPCMCDFPITATFGPFEPGTYIFAVYQNEGFIGTTTVTIGPTQ